MLYKEVEAAGVVSGYSQLHANLAAQNEPSFCSLVEASIATTSTVGQEQAVLTCCAWA